MLFCLESKGNNKIATLMDNDIPINSGVKNHKSEDHPTPLQNFNHQWSLTCSLTAAAAKRRKYNKAL